MLLGLALTASTLRRWFRRTVLLTVIAITFGAAVFDYGTYETTMSHAFSFFLVALTVRVAVAVWERRGLGGACALGASLGLVGLVRLTNLTVLVFCALVGVETRRDLAARARSLVRRLDLLAAGTGVFLLVLMWQLAYWHHITGAVFVNPYRGAGEHLDCCTRTSSACCSASARGSSSGRRCSCSRSPVCRSCDGTARPLFVPAGRVPRRRDVGRRELVDLVVRRARSGCGR